MDLEQKAVMKALAFSFLGAILPITGCAGGVDEEPQGNVQTAREVCGGLSKSAADTLKTIAGTDSFTSEPSQDSPALPSGLTEEVEKGNGDDEHVLCSIEPEKVKNEQRIRVYAKVLAELPGAPDERLRGNTPFKVGLRGEASALGAQLYFKCARGNADPTHAPVIKADFRYAPASRGEVSYQGNMQLLNEVSYRLAEQLSCLPSSQLSMKQVTE
ncbi:hypothetical protein ACGFYT_00115 [Streptomyces sp. NPDC048208]|uniref:hypothetical protein n=1 Tax=Streptomyces sp. NPDC048208 TaxID=3365515 RepID=UPI0037175AA0